jgi:acyl carrier protein
LDKQIILNKVLDIIGGHCLFNKDNVKLDNDLSDNYGIDSLALVEIFIEIECEFNILIDSNQLTYDCFSTINKMVDYVDKALN